MKLNKRELPFALLMSGCFFVFISIFWILKPLKKTFFIRAYDEAGLNLLGFHLAASQVELFAKILNLVVAVGAAYLFARLVKKFRQSHLIHVLCVVSLLCTLGLKLTLSPSQEWSAWAFYLYGDFFVMMMVAGFFAFLNDVSTPDYAKRLYGLVGFGGVAGGVFGSSMVRVWIKQIDVQTWLTITLGLLAVLAFLAHLAGRQATKLVSAQNHEADKKPISGAEVPSQLTSLKEIFSSPYLVSILAMVVCYELTSQMVDYQYTTAVSNSLDGAAIGEYFSSIFAITNILGLVTQLFLTSFVMSRFGVLPALLILPIALSLGSVGYLIAPTLLVGSFMSVLDNSLNYSIFQSAREALYVRVPVNTLYKAKPVIDIVAVRLGKVFGIGVTLIITVLLGSFELTRWLSLLTLGFLAAWIFFGIRAGRRFDEIAIPAMATEVKTPEVRKPPVEKTPQYREPQLEPTISPEL